MTLPEGFQFTQNNLQDFIDCPRRFELRHVLRQKWPAIQSEPYLEQERRMQLGSLFHEAVRQYYTGIPTEAIAELIDTPEISAWWRAFLAFTPLVPPAKSHWTEHLFMMTLENFRLAAKYDLVVITRDENVVIVDWKTSLRRPSKKFLRQRVQSRLYPFLLTSVVRSQRLFSLRPEQLTMIYWFSEFPDDVERISYSQYQYAEDEKFITSVIKQIQRISPGQFLLTQDSRACIFCAYRSLCDRGRSAGQGMADQDDESEPDKIDDFDFDQITEIAF